MRRPDDRTTHARDRASAVPAPSTSNAASRGPIAVVGAYGHTGRFVVSELHRRGWAPVLVGRDAAKLDDVRTAHPRSEVRTASVDDPASLDRAIEGAVLVINCAGPFGDTAPAVIEAAFRAGIHYVDVSGEALVALSTFERYATPAKERGVVVAPSVGFFGALGDLLATVAMGDWSSADVIDVAVALDHWHPTRGTRLAMERRAGRRVVFTNGRIEIRSGETPPPSAVWRFPSPMGPQEVVGELPTVDVVTISRHLRVREIRACLNRAPILDLMNPDTPGPAAAGDDGASAQTFLVEVVARRGNELRRAMARGRDIYAVTAPIVAETAERILDGRRRGAGAVAVGEILDAEDFLQSLTSGRFSFETCEGVADSEGEDRT